LFSLFYRLVVFLRRFFFKIGIPRRKRISQRVISVGNITLGGTGKTPTVMHIARLLLRHKRQPVVISRGYGRKDEAALVVVSDGKHVCVDTETGGDEPVLIGSKLPGVPVVVGSNRFKAALFAHQTFGNDTVILDDGFQHIRLERDLDIVLLDAADPFGSGKLFPAGILREPLSALKRADLVLLTGADRVGDVEAVKRAIRRHTGAQIFTSRPVPADIINITSGDVKPLSSLRAASILAFAGIARPASFLSLLRSLGADVKAEFVYPDHYAYKKSDLTRFFLKAADEKLNMIVTTEKDAVRLQRLRPEGIWALRIEVNIVENHEWEAVLLNKP
jgi:tetraacyldisaccharide 4'-kinase